MAEKAANNGPQKVELGGEESWSSRILLFLWAMHFNLAYTIILLNKPPIKNYLERLWSFSEEEKEP